MKKIISISLLAFAALFSSCKDKNAFTITGNFSENTYDGKMVYLQQMDTTSSMLPIVIDSAKVAEGKFTFKGKVAEYPIIGFVSVGKLQDRGSDGTEDNSPVGTLALEPGDIVLTFAKTAVTLSGTPKNDEFNKLHASLNKMVDMYKEATDAGGPQNVPADASGLDFQTRINNLQSEINKASFDFTKANMDNRIGEFLFISSANSFNEDQLRELISLSDSTFKSKPQIQALIQKLNTKVPKVGEQITDVKFVDQKGNPVLLSSYVGKNKVVLIDFWASWCGPCIKEIPNLTKMYSKYKSKGFEIVGISVDEDHEAWLGAIEMNKMSWIQLIDADGSGAQAYGVQAIPHTVLVDKNGTIVAVKIGSEELEKKVAELLK